MRELLLMVEARRRDAWEHTGSLMAAWLGGKPDDYSPYRERYERGERSAMTPEMVNKLEQQLAQSKAKREAASGGQ